MKDKYRIVEYCDGNGAKFYTIQFEFTWFFGLKHWRTLQSYSSDGSCSRPRMFDTIEDAQRFIRGQEWTKKVVYEGEL